VHFVLLFSVFCSLILTRSNIPKVCLWSVCSRTAFHRHIALRIDTYWVCDGIADTGYEAGVVYQRLCLIYLDDAELKHHHNIHILSHRQHQTVPTVPTEPPVEDLRPPLSTADEFEELWSLLESTNLLLVLSCSGIGCPLAMLVPVTFPQTVHLLTAPRRLPTQILHRQIRQKIVQNTASGEVCSWPRVLLFFISPIILWQRLMRLPLLLPCHRFRRSALWTTWLCGQGEMKLTSHGTTLVTIDAVLAEWASRWSIYRGDIARSLDRHYLKA